MPGTLTEWLGCLDPDRLADVLAARADVCDPPVPPDLAALAGRLTAPRAVLQTVQRLPTPAVEVLQVLVLLGPDGTDRRTLGAWLGCPEDDPDLHASLQLLAGSALVWPDGDILRTAPPLHEIPRYQATLELGRFPVSLDRFRFPLGLGAPAATLLSHCPPGQLRAIARTLQLSAGPRRADLATAIAEVLRDPEKVRALVDAAPPATRDRLSVLASHGPPLARHPAWASQQVEPELHWAAARGLVLTDAHGVVQPPREVAVTLRGDGWHAPFHPRRPAPALMDAPPGIVERQAAAAAGAAVEAAGVLLATVETGPVTIRKTGGVGARELRRLSRTTGLPLPVVQLWLEVAHETGLVAVAPDRAGGGELLPTAGYDTWVGREPADQLAALLPGWLRLAAAPLLPAPPGSRTPPTLVREYGGALAAQIRRSILDLLAGLPAGRGIAGRGIADRTEPSPDLAPAPEPEPAVTERGLVAALSWQAPLLIDPDRHAGLVGALWHEAQLTGAVAHGSATALGRALLAGDDSDLATACRRLLPPPTTEAVFQADLTALVPGTPHRELALLLDATAERESRGGAVTWRFSAGSVRRALDAGWQADTLLAALRERAAGGTLPQPLAYLIGDVARRHGAIRVREVGCVLHTDDPALATELTGARPLRPLRLRLLAPTVLSCAAAPEQALAALRAAGYAPAAEDADGVPQSTQIRRRRATGGGRTRRHQPAPADDTAEALRQYAAQLLATPVPTEPDGGPFERAPQTTDWDQTTVDEFTGFAHAAPHLDATELQLLTEALAQQLPVTISYTDREGEQTVRVIEPVERDGAHLIAWCHLRDDERRFALHRISSVAPADDV